MKYLLTENKLKNLLEDYIKHNFPEVVSVSFSKQGVYLGHDDKSIQRNIINIVIDPYGILKGNLPRSFNSGYDYLENKNREFILKIRRDIDEMFSLKIFEYGSEWDIDVWTINLQGPNLNFK